MRHCYQQYNYNVCVAIVVSINFDCRINSSNESVSANISYSAAHDS